MPIDSQRVDQLKKYLQDRGDIVMVFILGSQARKQAIAESDFDIAVYYKTKGRELEWEKKCEYPNEDSLGLEIQKIVGLPVDLVVLNRAPANFAAEIIRTGVPLIIKDKNLYWRFFLLVSAAADEFRDVVHDWLIIRERSASLSEEDRRRLIRAVDFLESELKESSKFNALSQREYEIDSDKRRNIERWVENIVNASIDIAKIILASEKKPLPETYAEVILNLGLLEEFNNEASRQLAEFARLRNILAHEYLDLRYYKIKKFSGEAERLYSVLLKFAKKKII